MKPIAERTLCTDLEIVYEPQQPYLHLLQQLAAMADLNETIAQIEETWHYYDETDICIELRYLFANEQHTMWIQRHGDYLQLRMLCLLNLQCKLTDPRFEYDSLDEKIYFITHTEKAQLEAEGSELGKLDATENFLFLASNVMQFLKHADVAAYPLLQLLATHSAAAKELHRESKWFADYQRRFQSEIIDKIDWQQTIAHAVDMEKLYAFTSAVPGLPPKCPEPVLVSTQIVAKFGFLFRKDKLGRDADFDEK